MPSERWKTRASELKRALRTGWGWLQDRAPASRLLEIGFGWRTLLVALALTLVSFSILNVWLCRAVDGSYADFRVEEVARAEAAAEAAEVLIQRELASPEIRGWLAEQLSGGRHRAPLQEQLLTFIGSGVVTAGEHPQARAERLRELATGRRGGWSAFRLTAESTTGAEIISELCAVDGGLSCNLLEEVPDGREKREFLVRYADRLAAAVHPSLRWLRRFNGAVQWLTVALAWLVVCLLIRRYLFVNRLQSEQADARANGDDTADPLVQSRLERAAGFSRSLVPAPWPDHALQDADSLRRELNDRVYRPLEVMVGLIPSLGFVGTVIGMGDALLKADGLLNAPDKQKAISDMTQQLGYAFDTTLVALVLAILTAALVAWQHNRELKLLEQRRTRAPERPAVVPDGVPVT